MGSTAIRSFWRAFEQHCDRLAEAKNADAAVYDLLLKSLQSINEDLWFEFASGIDGSELNVTAQRNRALFKLVESVVEAAPSVPGWTIHALKPKIGFPVTAKWEAVTISMSDVEFDPLKNQNMDLGLRVYVHGLAPVDIGAAKQAILRAIDHGLGERAHAESVAYIEVQVFPDDAARGDFIPLVDLEKYVAWRRKRLKGNAGPGYDEATEDGR